MVLPKHVRNFSTRASFHSNAGAGRPFFPANDIGADGHVGGNVVYALDLGPHNEVLRPRFGSRTWYRFGPHRTPGDSVPSLIPYAATPP